MGIHQRFYTALALQDLVSKDGTQYTTSLNFGGVFTNLCHVYASTIKALILYAFITGERSQSINGVAQIWSEQGNASKLTTSCINLCWYGYKVLQPPWVVKS